MNHSSSDKSRVYEPYRPIQADIDQMRIDRESKQSLNFSGPLGKILGFLYFSTLGSRSWWTGVILDKGASLLSNLPTFTLGVVVGAEPVPTDEPQSGRDQLVETTMPTFNSEFTFFADQIPYQTQSVLNQTRHILHRNLSTTAVAAMDTIIGRFITEQRFREFKTDHSPVPRYSELSLAEKNKLLKRVLKSIAKQSLTASGEAKKLGRPDEGELTQSPKEATDQLQTVFYEMVKLSKNGQILTLEKLDELYRIALPAAGRAFPSFRSFELNKYGVLFFMDPPDLRPAIQNLLDLMHNPPPEMPFPILEAILNGIFLTAHPYRDGNGRLNMLVAVGNAIRHDQLPPVFDFKEGPGQILHGIVSYFGSGQVAQIDQTIKSARSSPNEQKSKFAIQFPFQFGTAPSKGCLTQFDATPEEIDRFTWNFVEPSGTKKSFSFAELHQWIGNLVLENFGYCRNISSQLIGKETTMRSAPTR